VAPPETDTHVPQSHHNTVPTVDTMAVLDGLPGLGAIICVDGEALEEYEDDEEETFEPGPVGEYKASRTVSKYIQSSSTRSTLSCSNLAPHTEWIVHHSHPESPRPCCADIPTKFGHTISFHRLATHGVKVSEPGSGASNRFLIKPFKFARIETCKFAIRFLVQLRLS
jgi:hypothetical protein